MRENPRSWQEFQDILHWVEFPVYDSVNQLEILQPLGSYTFSAHFECEELIQMVVLVMEKLDWTKVNRLPALRS